MVLIGETTESTTEERLVSGGGDTVLFGHELKSLICQEDGEFVRDEVQFPLIASFGRHFL